MKRLRKEFDVSELDTYIVVSMEKKTIVLITMLCSMGLSFLIYVFIHCLVIIRSIHPKYYKKRGHTDIVGLVQLLSSQRRMSRDISQKKYVNRRKSDHLSKRMLFTLTRMMALEFAPTIRVNAVAPGLILPPPGEDLSYLENLVSNNPLHRVGSVDGITDAVLFLLRSEFITGQVIFVDGGYHMKGCVHG